MPYKDIKMNNLIKNETKSTKIINYISTIFGGLTIFFLYKVLRTFVLTSAERAELGIFIAFDIIPVVVIPIAAILFWSRNRSGWILMVLFSIYSLLSSISTLIMAPNILYLASSGIEYKDLLISAIVNFLLFLIYLATIIILSTANIREIYRINQKTLLITFGTMLGVIITLAYLFVTMVLSHFV